MGDREIKYKLRLHQGSARPRGRRITRYFTPEQIEKNNARFKRSEKIKGNPVDKDTCHPCHSDFNLECMGPEPTEGVDDANPLRDNVPS